MISAFTFLLISRGLYGFEQLPKLTHPFPPVAAHYILNKNKSENFSEAVQWILTKVCVHHLRTMLIKKIVQGFLIYHTAQSNIAIKFEGVGHDDSTANIF